MTKSEFLTVYPEFSPAEAAPEAGGFPGLIDAHLADAEACTSDSWGDKRELVVGLHAAHALALSPFGRNAQLVAKDGSTTYGERLRLLKLAHAADPGKRLG